MGILSLPKLLHDQLLLFLDIDSIIVLSQVNKQFNMVVDCNKYQTNEHSMSLFLMGMILTEAKVTLKQIEPFTKEKCFYVR